ncbi:hypothetical protein F4819DRAFT_465480 [Hypoxylon fuscum]|nr:hypothetical protein F4819DRAFT_465480 [Hypoxylon fuscum]
MAELQPSTSAPSQGLIKVYATAKAAGDPQTDWSDPRKIHLHVKTPTGTTTCCQSVTAGGIVEDPDGTLFFLTSDQFVPLPSHELERYTDTNDGTCACIGSVKHTSRRLHYTMITINDSVADSASIDNAKNDNVSVASKDAFGAALNTICLKHQLAYEDKRVMARTQHNDIIKGRVGCLIRKGHRHSPSQDNYMMAAFESNSAGNDQVDTGMWVYTRRPKGSEECGSDRTIDETIHKLDSGSYSPGVFRYYPKDTYHGTLEDPNPLILVGHVVEVHRQGLDHEGPVEAKIHDLYDIFTDIFVEKGKLNDPCGTGKKPGISCS